MFGSLKMHNMYNMIKGLLYKSYDLNVLYKIYRYKMYSTKPLTKEIYMQIFAYNNLQLMFDIQNFFFKQQRRLKSALVNLIKTCSFSFEMVMIYMHNGWWWKVKYASNSNHSFQYYNINFARSLPHPPMFWATRVSFFLFLLLRFLARALTSKPP